MKTPSTFPTVAACAAAVLAFSLPGQAQQMLVPENQSWTFLHPMGTLPPRTDTTPDPDFDTSWYLPEAQFLTAYDGPSFSAATLGDPLIPNSADSGPGIGPFAYGVVDGIAAPGTALTLPATGNRYASYYRTGFTVPAGGLIEPSIRMICDDGSFIYLDGVLIATVNVTDGVTDAYTSFATDATNTELGFTIPLRASGSLPGGSPGDVKVIVPIPALTAGDHTLAVSVRNNAATSSDMGLLMELSALDPDTSTIHAVVTDVVRDLKGSPADVSDDEFSFKVTLSGNNTGATWTSDNPVVTGAYGVTTTMGPYSAAGPAFVTFTTAANAASQTTVTVNPPTAFTTLVNYNQSWKLMNPLAGVVPPRPTGGADTNFEDTWHLKEDSFLTQYDGPNFGANGVAGSYEAITGPGPFAGGTVDGIVVGQPVGAAATTVTLPATPNRLTSYYRTTFTTTQPMSLVTFDLLCDDGTFIYLDGNLVAQENMPGAPGFTSLAAAARGETLITTIDLSQAPGGNVIATVPGLAPGVHTLAVSVHQSATNSSDFGLALKMSGIEVVGQPVIEASVSDVVRSEADTPGVPDDDTFTFKVNVNGANAGSTWTSNSVPASGSYGVLTTFGPFPVVEGTRTVQFTASIDPGTVTSITVTPPASTIAAVFSGVTRNNNGTPVDPRDDTMTFNVTVTGTFLSTQWTSNVTAPNAGNYHTATPFGPFPATAPLAVVLTDSIDVARTVSFTVQPPRYIPPVEMVPYSQSWKVMNPLGGVLPDGPGGPDDNFDTTWFLPESAFVVQYNGPTFGAGGVAGSYETLEGPGPFAVGGIDGLATGTTIGPAGTAITLPATANRFSSYYRTTFTTTEAIDNVKFDLLCDDGVFIYLDGVLVAQENMPGTDTFAALASAARAETLITTIDLSALPGGNVVATVPSIPASTHTLAVSVHQSGADSSDKGLALTFYGRAATGVVVTPVLGNVTRNLNNTVTTDDDTFRFPITVNATNGGTAGWISNEVPASGNYGVSTEFGPFPVSASPKSLTFTDTTDDLARATLIVTPPSIFGLTTFGGIINPVVPTLPLPANWTANGATIAHSTNVGIATPGTQISSEVVNLSGVTGAIQFRMDLVAADTSAGSNFEAADTVLAELVLHNGVSEQRINLISNFDSNGDGVLNGFTGVDAADYNTNKDQDELNGAFLNAEDPANYTFALSRVIPDDIISAQVVVTVVAVGGTESITLSNVTFGSFVTEVDTDGDGQSDASEALAGTSPTDPADALRVTGLTPNGTGLSVSFPSKTGRNYRIETSTRLVSGWVPLGDVIAGTGADISADLAEVPVTGESRYFLRVRVVP
jgi:hypothetical protein